MIEVHDLSKHYGTIEALSRASFKIGAHEVVGLLGPNGAGKTTLMKILTGYMHPTEGTARVDGMDVVEQPLSVQARIGYLPENAPLYPDMVVQEYLQMIAELRELPTEQRTPLILAAAERTGLSDYLVRPIGQLSKGYRQRVGLAQAILHRPNVLILDEPTTGLDPTQIVEIRRLIKELSKNATVLLSTHILSEVELTCERVLIISGGKLCSDAQMAQLHESHAAFVSVDGDPNAVRDALNQLPGVTAVKPGERRGAYTGFQLLCKGSEIELCPAIFDLVKQRGWRLNELRADQRTLESVFREVVEAQRHTADAAPATQRQRS